MTLPPLAPPGHGAWSVRPQYEVLGTSVIIHGDHNGAPPGSLRALFLLVLIACLYAYAELWAYSVPAVLEGSQGTSSFELFRSQ